MWMCLNMLKLNDDKTEVLLISSNNSLNHLRSVSVKLDNDSVASSQSVTNLGCVLDRRLNINDFVIRKCQSATFHLRSRARKYLTTDATKSCICHITIGLCKQPLIWCSPCSAEQTSESPKLCSKSHFQDS